MTQLSEAEKLINDVLEDHQSGLIKEKNLEDDVVELVNTIIRERDEGRLESDELKEAKMELFSMLCLKDYLNECQPVNCVFRMTGECEYIDTIGKINSDEKRRINP
jgi:hypothetical protein